jgi:hypothetical protein
MVAGSVRSLYVTPRTVGSDITTGSDITASSEMRTKPTANQRLCQFRRLKASECRSLKKWVRFEVQRSRSESIFECSLNVSRSCM